MAKFLKGLFDALGLEVLYKYVLSACVCRSECCSHENGCLCSCQTQEIHHHDEPDDDFITCMKVCCGAAEEIEDDVLSEDRDPHLFSGGDIYKE